MSRPIRASWLNGPVGARKLMARGLAESDWLVARAYVVRQGICTHDSGAHSYLAAGYSVYAARFKSSHGGEGGLGMTACNEGRKEREDAEDAEDVGTLLCSLLTVHRHFSNDTERIHSS